MESHPLSIFWGCRLPLSYCTWENGTHSFIDLMGKCQHKSCSGLPAVQSPYCVIQRQAAEKKWYLRLWVVKFKLYCCHQMMMVAVQKQLVLVKQGCLYYESRRETSRRGMLSDTASVEGDGGMTSSRPSSSGGEKHFAKWLLADDQEEEEERPVGSSSCIVKL